MSHVPGRSSSTIFIFLSTKKEKKRKMVEMLAIIPKYLMIISSISFLILSQPGITITSWPPPIEIADRFRNDSETIKLASVDYGHIVEEIPATVFHPTSINDTARLVKFAYNNNNNVPITIAARGRGHSVRGQGMARDGVVINMTSLENRINGSGISVSRSPSLGFYADAGGEQLWIDLLHATLEHGLAPVSWTDYLYLTVGGTLSNAGISGQTFRFGPQISNVHELDVITGMS